LWENIITAQTFIDKKLMSEVVLITGASSGIGKVTGTLLHQNGYRVYGVSRRIESKELLFESINMDVTDEANVKLGIHQILEKEGKIDVLINSAGYSLTGALEDVSNEEIKQQFDTNVFGLLNMTRNVIPTMRSLNKGLIINISSIGGLMGLPFQGAYSATKFALEGISESMNMELRQFNIQVKIVAPGDISTAFTENRKLAEAANEKSSYAEQFNSSLAQIVKDENVGEDPIKVANKILRLVEGKTKKFRSIVAILEQKLAVVIKRTLPHPWFETILKKHYRLP